MEDEYRNHVPTKFSCCCQHPRHICSLDVAVARVSRALLTSSSRKRAKLGMIAKASSTLPGFRFASDTTSHACNRSVTNRPSSSSRVKVKLARDLAAHKWERV